MSFELPSLPYAHDALEPHVDTRTMEIHHGKHHAGYTNKLNAAIAGTADEGKSIEDILGGLDMNNKAVRNNGGGYYNHCLFWEVMSPNGGGTPGGVIWQMQSMMLLADLKRSKMNFLKPPIRALDLDGRGYVCIPEVGWKFALRQTRIIH